jgi:nucleoid-associated protein YgaU
MLVLTLATGGGVQAQDAATQQQIDKLAGALQDVIVGEASQGKQLEAMEREIAELREKVNTPVVNDSASTEDLKKLAVQLRELDQKRQDDKELILGKIEELGKIAAAAPPHVRHTSAAPKEPTEEESPAASQTHLEHVVKDGENLTAIVKAFHDKGVKVTLAQVLKANPGLNEKKLFVGKVIIIPIPDAAK